MPDTPDVTEGMTPEELATYQGVQASFKEDPETIPEKMRSSEDPALAFLEAYKSAEQKITEQGQELKELKTPEVPEVPEVPDVIETVDFDAKPEVSSKSLDWAVQVTAGNGGKPTNEVLQYLKETHNMSEADVENHFVPTVQVKLQEQIDSVLAVTGGADGFNTLKVWVDANKTRPEIDAINNSVKDPLTRATTIRGLMLEAELTTTMNKQLNPQTSNNVDPSVKGYSSNQELWDDLASPELKSNSHPDHVAKSQAVEARIAATKPGILA